MEYGWADFVRQKQIERSLVRISFTLSQARLAQLKRDPSTSRIKYPEHKESFDYVCGIYPTVDAKRATVYYASPIVLKAAGYQGVGGFYDIHSRVIVITDSVDNIDEEFGVCSKFTQDEVLCHELIHFCANANAPASSVAIEEEIAYGKSIGYLQQKGRSDDYIIENMLPYLFAVVDRVDVIKAVLLRHHEIASLIKLSEGEVNDLLKPLSAEVFTEMKIAAQCLGKKMLSIYGSNSEMIEIKRAEHLLIMDEVE